MQYIFELVNKGKGTYGKDGIQLVEEDLLLLKEPPPEGSGLPNGGTTNQVLTKNSNTDQDASWKDPATTGTGGGLTKVAFVTHLRFDKNYKSETIQTGALAFTKDSTGLILADHYSNRYEIEIQANGTGGIPTFSTDFVIQYSDWSNNTGDINRLIFIISKTGKIAVWLDNVITA